MSEKNELDEKMPSSSNEKLLCIAFVSFMGFAIAQTIAAFMAGSEAMKGDSAAMIVDALTAYLFNWYAERKKQKYAEKLRGQEDTRRSLLLYQKYTHQLELVPPLLAVTILLVVTGLVFKEAIGVLVLDAKRDVALQADPNTHLMLLFSCLNLLLDVLNVFCFAKAKHSMASTTISDEDGHNSVIRYITSMQSLLNSDDRIEYELANDSSENEEELEGDTKMKPMEIEESRVQHGDCHDEEGSNLNMCSAFTHVFADTLRSIAVILAAILAEFVPSITSEEADSGAAVVVSILIAFSLIPLFHGVLHTFSALRRVHRMLEQMEKGMNDEDDEENALV